MAKRAGARTNKRTCRLDLIVLIGVGIALLIVGAAAWQIVSASRGGKTLTTEAQVQRISPAEAAAMIGEGKAVLYDVRSREAYAAKHAVGAQPLPESELDSLVASLPKDKVLILYCT